MIGWVVRIPEWGNANILEILWTGIGLVTLLIVTWNYSGAKQDLVVPVHLEDVYAREAAATIRRGYIRREAVRFVTALLILATGVTGDVVASARHPTVTTLTGLVTTTAFFLIGLMTTAQSFFDQRDRHDIRDLLLKSRRYKSDTDYAASRAEPELADT